MADRPIEGNVERADPSSVDHRGKQGIGAPTEHLEILFRAFTRPIIYVLVLLGLHLFLRGHNAPGGGFIAGLVVAVAALLSRIVLDKPLMRFSANAIIPWGLLLAFATGVVPLFFGLPFLKSAHDHVTWPLIGEFEWATAVLFDAGVFIVVVGTTLTIIELLAGNTDESLSDLGATHESSADGLESDDNADKAVNVPDKVYTNTSKRSN